MINKQDIIETQDFEHFRIIRQTRTGRMLSMTQYTPETFPFGRVCGAAKIILDPSLSPHTLIILSSRTWAQWKG